MGNDVTRTTFALTPREAHLDDVGAPGDGTTDARTKIQELVDLLASYDGGIITGGPDKSYKVATPVDWKSGVYFKGNGRGATTIKGTAGQDIITLPSGSPYGSMGFEDVAFSGGVNQLVSTRVTTGVTLRDVLFSGPSGSCVYIEGAAEEWYLDSVVMSGGQYGFRKVFANNGSGNYLDKCTFKDVLTAGQSINGWRIEAATSGSLTWINPIINTAGQHGFYADGGGSGWVFINPNTEGNGQTGKKVRTTGTISSASASLVVASATGFAQGDPVYVRGAGADGVGLFTTISSITGTTFTLADAASTAVTDAYVTNASYDDFYFTNLMTANPTTAKFVGGLIGGEGTGGRLRFAINARLSGNIGMDDVATLQVPVYDPNFSCSGYSPQATVHRPVSYFNHAPKRPSFFRDCKTIIPSADGQDLDIYLSDSSGNGSGTLGNLSVYRGDSNRTKVLSFNPTTAVLRQERSTGSIQTAGLLHIDEKANPATCAVGDFNVHTDHKLYQCTATNTWSLVGSQS